MTMRGLKSVMLVLMAVSLMLAIPAIALAAPPEVKKAKTIDELAKMFDSTGCKGCHAEIYGQWEKSHHARPLMGVQGGLMLTPVVKDSAFSPKDKDSKNAKLSNFPCFKCHLPQALRFAEDSVAVELAQALDKGDAAAVGKLQITCLVCHNEKAIVHKLQDGYPDAATLYGTKDVAAHPDARFKQVKKSVILKQAIFCGQCHGTGPNFEFENPVQCATLYGSYQHNYLAEGGSQSCQECHMQLVNGKPDHLIAPDFNDQAGTAELLKNNVELDVQTLGFQWLRKAGDLRPMVVVNTKVSTKAGHRVPDG